MGELRPIRSLDLYAGVGGGLLSGTILGWETICAVEIDDYCQQVLSQRQKDGILPWFPIYDDIKEFDGTSWRGLVDVVTGGFPCPPWSCAGKRKGELDERNLWPDTIRVIREVRPRYCLLENVPGLASTGYFRRILGDLAEEGYDIAWDIISARDVGAPHLRKRLWIVADARGVGQREQNKNGNSVSEEGGAWKILGSGSVGVGQADSNSERQLQQGGGITDFRQRIGNRSAPKGVGQADPDSEGLQGYGGFDSERECACQWAPWACSRSHEDERLARSSIRRISTGVSNRLDRLKGLGNAQVPLCAAYAFLKLVADE